MLLLGRMQAPRRQTHRSSELYSVLSKAKSHRRYLASHRVFRPLSQQNQDDRVIKGSTWYTPDPSTVQPSDVLKQLTNTGHHPALDTAIILATPSFTHWLDRDNDFLAKAIHLLSFGHTNGPKIDSNSPSTTVRTRSAIVDRIPLDTNLTLRSQTSSRGCEGISVLLLGRKLRSLTSDRKAPGARSQNAHVRFVAQIDDQERQLIALPVANTMFRNGRESTSFEDVWELDTEMKNGTRFRRLSRAPLNSFDVATSPPSNLPFVGIPMSPLTRPHEIVSSIGNVIRELKRGDTGSLFPASTDLEAVVPQFLKSSWLTETAKRTFSVFALITRKDFYAGTSDAVRAGYHPPGRRFLLRSLFDGSARLHRVTGGGGGWGNKKGLLSLEPGIDIFAKTHNQLPALPPEGEDYDFQGTSALVSPGDNVQFFATFSGPTGPVESSPTREGGKQETYLEKEAAIVEAWRRNPRKFPPRVVVGTNPPDEEYSTTLKHTSLSTDKLILAPDYFGMLSEGGVCLGRTKANAFPPDGDHVSFMSRLDIPFTTLIAEATLQHASSLHSGRASRRVVLQAEEK